MTAVCNKIKSIVAFAVICVILSLPLDAFASGDSDFVYYIKNGKVCVSGYRGVSDTILVPEKLRAKRWRRLTITHFRQTEPWNLSAYPIPSPQSAKRFSDCTALSYVSFGANLNEIGDNAFSGCYSLKKQSLKKELHI